MPYAQMPAECDKCGSTENVKEYEIQGSTISLCDNCTSVGP